MGMLSIGKYAALCVLGGEVAYTVCMVYGNFLSGAAARLHADLFALFPGFSGLNFASWFWGALTVAVWFGVAGVYIAWMHNVSVEK